MPTRKKNAAQPRQGRCKNFGENCGEHFNPPPPPRQRDIDAMLMIGTEHVVIHAEQDENIDFMAELIDP